MRKYKVYWSTIIKEEIVEARNRKRCFEKAFDSRSSLFKQIYPNAKIECVEEIKEGG